MFSIDSALYVRMLSSFSQQQGMASLTGSQNISTGFIKYLMNHVKGEKLSSATLIWILQILVFFICEISNIFTRIKM